jgi:nucleoside-diphosphate-sugar epimerase
MSNKCAVVMGANDFIGRNLVISLLKKDYFVFAIVTEESLKDLCNDNLKQAKLFFEDSILSASKWIKENLGDNI